MTEVNEAAKIITAAADEDAKIIFGAVITEKMKDEIKITVVATGFDGRVGQDGEVVNPKSTYTQNTFIAEKEKEVSRKKDVTPDNTERPKPKASPLRAAQAEPAKKKKVDESTGDEGDDLGIPAFIRKKMGG